MACNTRLFILTAEESRGATGVVWCVARKAGVLCDRGVAADIGLSNGLVHGGGMNSG